jgi:putative tryptophan/tyrosine transport system substrate-binding protein
MLRRVVFAVLGGSIVLLALRVQADEQVHYIGVLTPAESPELTKAWLEGLREHGHVEGRNLRIEYRVTEGSAERTPGLAVELAALNPEIIVAASPAPALAVKAATLKLPRFRRVVLDLVITVLS